MYPNDPDNEELEIDDELIDKRINGWLINSKRRLRGMKIECCCTPVYFKISSILFSKSSLMQSDI